MEVRVFVHSCNKTMNYAEGKESAMIDATQDVIPVQAAARSWFWHTLPMGCFTRRDGNRINRVAIEHFLVDRVFLFSN